MPFENHVIIPNGIISKGRMFDVILSFFKEQPELNQLIQLVIGLVGFSVTIFQLQRTRTAAIASKEATESAIDLLSERETIADISRMASSLAEVQVALGGQQFSIAALRIRDVRFSLGELKQRRGFNTSTRKSEIQSMIVDIKNYQEQVLRKEADDEYSLNTQKINGKLDDCIGRLREWGEELRYSARRGE